MQIKSLFIIAFVLVWGMAASAQSWQARFSAPLPFNPGTSDPDLSQICPLNTGNSIACGFGYGVGGFGTLLYGLSPQGDLLWRRVYEESDKRVSVFDMYPLPNGNALVLFSIGVPQQPLGLLERILIAEVSGANGAIVWQRYVGTNDNPGYYSRAVIAQDGIYLGGRLGDFVSLAKLDFNGDLVWQSTFNDGSVAIVGEIADLALSPDGYLYAVARHFVPLGDVSDYFTLLKFTDQGDWLWARRYQIDGGARLPYVSALSLSDSGDPIILGSSYLPGPVSFVPFFLRTDSDGEVVSAWRRDANPTGGNTLQNIIPLGNDEFLLAFDGPSRAFQYVRYNLADGVKWTRYYDVTDQAYVHFKTRLGADGYLYSVCQRLNLFPLERISVVSRTDDLLFDQASCCLKEGILNLSDYTSAFQATPVSYSPQPGEWILEDFAFASSPVNVVRQFICQVADLSIALSDTAVCAGGCITVQSASPEAGPLTWSVAGQQPTTSELPVEFCFDQPGAYQIKVESASDPCLRGVATLRVFPIPAPNIAVSDSMFCPGECVRFTLDSLLPGYEYSWVFEGGEPATFTGPEPPEICYDQSGAYAVRAKVVGCGAEGVASVMPAYRPARTPNAFTPNGDGVNDRFFPLLDCPADPYRFAVYNRWGQKVFESLRSGEGWDGSVEGRRLPSDAYIWVLELRDLRDDGEPVSELLKGEVFLMR